MNEEHKVEERRYTIVKQWRMQNRNKCYQYMLNPATHVTLWCNFVSMEYIQGKNCQFSEHVEDDN